MITIRRYTPADKKIWDEFAAGSKNATFLHLRDYMDYHADRFSDFSLMAFDEKGKLLALLPANLSGSTLHSHQGLTYGGWLTPVKHFNAATMLEVFGSMEEFLRANGITALVYKAIPYIYHRYPADEDIYALFRHGAQISECNISATAVIGSPLRKYNNSTKLNIAKMERIGMTVSETSDFPAFWEMLTAHLQRRYHTKPVHNIEEIQRLHDRFPQQIRLFEVRTDGRAVAGGVFFITDTAVHSQYTGNTEEGMRLKAVAFMHHRLMTEVFPDKQFYDFGTSNEQHGRLLNEGLIVQKNGLGGRGVAYTTYKIDFR